MIDDNALCERLRASNENHLALRLVVDLERQRAHRKTVQLKQALTGQRWWSVAYLCWVLREVVEPARYAHSYPTSWAFKIAVLEAHPVVMTCWFGTAAIFLVPLILALALAPRSKFCVVAQDGALIGLAMAMAGYAYMTTVAMRLDIPHVVDAYIGSTTMMAVTTLLVACWFNARLLVNRELTCAAPVL